MRVGLLGALSIEIDGESVTLGAPSTRKAFIYLALHAGTVVTSDRLAQAVWSDAPPASVERAVHSLVYRLRQQLLVSGTTVPLSRRGPGYFLDIDRSAIDLHEFEARLDEGHAALDVDPALARDIFVRALELWRGEPLLDVAYEPWALAEARRVCERYVGAREAIAACDIELGHLGRAIAELKGLTVTYPLRESLWALLWHALALQGRYSEVIASHRRCVRLLRDEFDIDPSSHLDALANEFAHTTRPQTTRH